MQLRRQKGGLRRKVREGRQRAGRMPGEVGKHRTTEPQNLGETGRGVRGGVGERSRNVGKKTEKGSP